VCQKCEKPAVGLLTWIDKMGRPNDFAGCESCARARRIAIEAEGCKVHASRLDEVEEEA
jgi:protein-arginine kinase activator protein McsA